MTVTSEHEQTLWNEAGVSRISDIDGFPFPSHAALRSAVDNGTAYLGIEYAAARSLVSIRSVKSVLFVSALGLVMPALALTSPIVAFFTGNWWALGGAISALLGRFSANPYIPSKRFAKLLVAGAVLHIVIARSIIQGSTWISFCFAASAIALWTLNHLAWKWAHDAALSSEAVAAYLFKTRNLHICDDHGEVYNVRG